MDGMSLSQQSEADVEADESGGSGDEDGGHSGLFRTTSSRAAKRFGHRPSERSRPFQNLNAPGPPNCGPEKPPVAKYSNEGRGVASKTLHELNRSGSTRRQNIRVAAPCAAK